MLALNYVNYAGRAWMLFLTDCRFTNQMVKLYVNLRRSISEDWIHDLAGRRLGAGIECND